MIGLMQCGDMVVIGKYFNKLFYFLVRIPVNNILYFSSPINASANLILLLERVLKTEYDDMW